MPKVRKAELLFLYVTRCLALFYISAKYHQNIQKSFSNKTNGDNSKSKKANPVCDMSSRPGLHFYQVSSKYSKGYSGYRADKKFYVDADANGICPKNYVLLQLWWWWRGLGGWGGGGGGGDIIPICPTYLQIQEDLIKTECYADDKVKQAFSAFKGMYLLRLIIRSAQFSNLSEVSSMSSFRKVQSKLNKLHWWQSQIEVLSVIKRT